MPDGNQEFREQVIEALTELRRDMKSLVGNGRPGRVEKLEEKVEQLDRFRNRALGIVTGISLVFGLISAIIHFVFKY